LTKTRTAFLFACHCICAF